MKLTWLVPLAALALWAAGCSQSGNPGAACKQSTDCASGVCRGDKCQVVQCTGPTGCMTGEACSGGVCVVSSGRPCKVSGDCPSGTGVCRGGMCVVQTCGAQMACQGDELCVTGRCAPSPRATTGHTMAAGGAVSTSGKHIHIGLTGQGKAVGRSTSSNHQQVTGATRVMGR